jgi:hypothetical protein
MEVEMRKLAACVLGAVSLAGASSGVPAALASTADAAKSKAPVLKALSYTPGTVKDEQGFLTARFTATVKLNVPAPSIYFEIQSTSSKNVEEEVGPEPSYRAGVHKVSFTTTALPGGTYKITLYARVRPPKGSSYDSAKPLKGLAPATLVVGEATETTAGAGQVTKV